LATVESDTVLTAAGAEGFASNREPSVVASRQTQQGGGRRSTPSEEAPLEPVDLEPIRLRAEELVRGMLTRMGFSAEVSSSVDEAAGEAVVSVRSESEGLLIGRRGQTLDSLEHIVNRMVLRGEAPSDGRVLLDIGDYRRRRRESLEELAGRLRARAVGERRTVQVSPMSPRDRKFLALAFAGDDAVEIRTLGAGFYRRVIVAPAGMGAAAVAAAEAGAGLGDEDAIETDAPFPGAEADR
jgi:spoIIIJ-associated protein